MKKKIITLAIALLAGLLMPALADEARYDADDQALYITFDECIPGNQYALFILASGADTGNIDMGSVLFADQYLVGGQGRLSLVFIQPGFGECDVVLGGVFSDGVESPRIIGSVSMPVDPKVLELPGALTTIEQSAFEGGAFTHVYLGGSVTAIGARAFANCAALVYIDIPAGVTDIADDVFADSPNVTIGCASGSAAWNYANAHGIPVVLTD